MAEGFGYGGGFSGLPYPFWLSSPSPIPLASAPPSLTTHPVESYDQTQRGVDPMISHGLYHRSPPDWSNNPSYVDHSRSHTPPSSFYADNSRTGNFGPRGEDMYSPSGYIYPEPSSYFVPVPPNPSEFFSERQRVEWGPYNSTTSATVSSLADMLIKNSQEPFYKPIPPPAVYPFDESRPGHFPNAYGRPESTNAVSGHPVEPSDLFAFDDNRSGIFRLGYGRPESMNAAVCGPPVDPCTRVPSLPVPSLETQALFDGSQTGRSFRDVVSTDAPPVVIQSSLRGSSVEPVSFDTLLELGHVRYVSENPDLPNESTGSGSPRSSHPLQFNVKSSGSLFKEKEKGSGVSSLYQRPDTLVSDSDKGISESSSKNAIEDLNCDGHRSWNHFMVSSEGPSAPTMFSVGSESCGKMKADIENAAAKSAVKSKNPSEGSANQPSEDVHDGDKACKLQEQMFDMMNTDKKTTLFTDLGIKGSSRSNVDDVSTGNQGDFPFPPSSPRVSSVVNAMLNMSEVLVYECFNNGSLLKPEQLENLDKVVENLTKCLKKITTNKTVAGESSISTQAMLVSRPNVVDLNEVSNVVAKDSQGFNVKAPGMDEDTNEMDKDKNEMTQSIKNILASNFPDGEENHPQTLLYKNLWLETEAALCSTTCMSRYHRIKNEIGNLKLQNRETADASTFMQEPFLNPHESVSIINNVDQETTGSLIKHGHDCGNDAPTMSHDAPQTSKFNSDPVDAVLSLMSRSFTCGLEQENHGNFKSDAQIPGTIQQEPHASTTEEKHNDVIDRFQILKHLETKRKLKSQNCPDPDAGVIDRFQILKQRETDRKLKSQNCLETRLDDQEDNPGAPEVASIGRSSHMSDVMDRFHILKRREAEQVQKSLNSLDMDPYSDSDDEQPMNKTQIFESLWSVMKVGEISQIETRVDTEPSAYDEGYESPTSDWEHVLKE